MRLFAMWRRIALASGLSLGCLGTSAAVLSVPAGATVAFPSGAAGLSCADLLVHGVLSVGASQLGSVGSVSIAPGGALHGGSGSIAVGGDWANAGTFTRATSLVAFVDGCTTMPAHISGATAFANLTLASSTGRTFVIPSGAGISVSGHLTLAGTAGSPIHIDASNPGQPASIDLAPTATVASYDYQLGTGAALNATALPRLANISTRGKVLTGFDVMIGGFVISGTAPKTVVVRGIGPSLTNFGVAGALSNPTVQLVRMSDNATIATNDDWETGASAAQVLATGFAPSNALESAIHAALQPGAYTAIVSGASGATGVGLIEVYEVDHPEYPLINISTRGKVLTGFDVMIGGFVVQGTEPQLVVIRAMGPSLAAYGVAGSLANPTMQLVRMSDNAVIATNDDWGNAANAAQVLASGFAPSDPLESAIMTTLAPGAYTVIVTGVADTTGVAIVEVYSLD